MKKTAQLWIVLSLALPFAACAAEDDNDDDNASTDPTGGTGDDAATMTAADDDAATMTAADDAPETGADDAPETGADDAPDTGADDGGGMACTHTCAADGDCMIGGMDVGLICQDSTCTLANPCAGPEDCVPQLSGWSFSPCTMGGGECAATMQVCVDLGDGSGGCATPPSEFVTCDLLMQEEVMVTDLDTGMETTVCGNTSGECSTETGYCYVPCVDDAGCGTLVCNTDTGTCECDSDDDCGEGGTCDAGVCMVPGCMDDSDCAENPFDGGMYGCQ